MLALGWLLMGMTSGMLWDPPHLALMLLPKSVDCPVLCVSGRRVPVRMTVQTTISSSRCASCAWFTVVVMPPPLMRSPSMLTVVMGIAHVHVVG